MRLTGPAKVPPAPPPAPPPQQPRLPPAAVPPQAKTLKDVFEAFCSFGAGAGPVAGLEGRMFSKSVGSVGRGRGCGCSGGGVAAHQPLTGQPWLHAHCRMMRDAALYGKGFTTTGGCRRYGNEPLDGKRPAPATQMFSQPGRVCPAPPADADLIFTAVKPKGAKRIGFEAFETALEKVRGEGGWWVPGGGGCRWVLVPAQLPSQHARSHCPSAAPEQLGHALPLLRLPANHSPSPRWRPRSM